MALADSALAFDTLGAFCRHTHVARTGATTGPLAGLTFGLKDIYDMSGYRTGFGSPDWLATHEPAAQTAFVPETLLAAGATLVGRTHTEEMAFSLTGENAHYGTPINPAAPDRVPGGSSSGSAAAVAGGLVDFAVGSDTGGSVRGPASFCGIYGMRPTHGRISLDGACPLAPRFDTCGWFARDAELLARVGAVLLNTPIADAWRPKRLLLADDAMQHATLAAREALRATIEEITRTFGVATSVVLCPDGFRPAFETFRDLQYADIWRTHREWVTRTRPHFGPQVGGRFTAVSRITDAEETAAEERRRPLVAALEQLLGNDAVLLMPTMPDCAPLRGASPEATVEFRERSLGLLCPAGLAGLPQLSLPAGRVAGGPIGLSLLAGRGQDAQLLAMARALSRSVEHGSC